jgi:hypothetical protein
MMLWQTPAIVVAVLTWLLTPPTSFGDAARREALRRELVPKAARSLTNQDVAMVPRRPLPTPPAPDTPTPAATDAAGKDKDAAKAGEKDAGKDAAKDSESHDEPWWHARMSAARDALERDRLMAESLQSRINALTNDASARDDPAQRQQLYDLRARTVVELDHLRDQVTSDQKVIDSIEEDARQQNVPAGWIR